MSDVWLDWYSKASITIIKKTVVLLLEKYLEIVAIIWIISVCWEKEKDIYVVITIMRIQIHHTITLDNDDITYETGYCEGPHFLWII